MTLKIFELNDIASKYIKQKLVEIQGEKKMTNPYSLQNFSGKIHS